MSISLFGVISKSITLKVLVINVIECMSMYLPTRTIFVLFQVYAMCLTSRLSGIDLTLSYLSTCKQDCVQRKELLHFFFSWKVPCTTLVHIWRIERRRALTSTCNWIGNGFVMVVYENFFLKVQLEFSVKSKHYFFFS